MASKCYICSLIRQIVTNLIMKRKLILFALLGLCPLMLSAQSSWAPVGDKIKTQWAAEVSPENCHAEYPRPEMVRPDWQNLNGLWDYAVTADSLETFSCADGQILVPFPLESSLSGVGRTISAQEALWYKTTFTLSEALSGKKVLLHFGAVDWSAEVFVNGRRVGSHTGGFTAFSFDITEYLTSEGPQELIVKVLDATENDFQPRGKQVLEPRGIWYTAVTGIWQSVWLEGVAETYIKNYDVIADLDGKTLTVCVDLEGAREGDKVKVSLLKGKEGYSTEKPGWWPVARAKAAVGEPLVLKVRRPKTWSPENPYLYGLKISVKRGCKTLDKVQAYTAMREITARKDAKGLKRMYLNGEPLFHYGPLDQGWWPDGLYTAPTDEALKHDLIMTKEYGFNMIRKHIKVEPSRWFYYCDQLGIMVWQDMPSFGDNGPDGWDYSAYDRGHDFPATAEAKANYYKEWGEIIDQHKKFQCIVVWVPFNEAWSQFDTKAAVDFTYGHDSTRLVNQCSGGNWVSGGVGDILDSHNYPMPGVHQWDPEMVVVVGEYGGIGLPLEGHLWQPDRNWGYVQYKNSEEVTAKYEEYAKQLETLVEQGVSGAVYTQTTDVEIEVNGLMTYDRAVNKLLVDRVREANEAVIAKMNE